MKKAIFFDLGNTIYTDKNLLAKKYTLGIITNDSRELTERVLDALGINKDLFTILVTYESVKNKKPDREPFEVAIQHLKSKEDDCCYVADSIEKDLEPAKKAGMKTVWVTNEKRKNTYVDYKIKNLFKLPEILNSL